MIYNTDKRIELLHPVTGEVVSWVDISLSTKKRSEIESKVIGKNYSLSEQYFINVMLASSVISAWDYDLFQVEYDYDSAVELLSDARYSFIVSTIANGYEQLVSDYEKYLKECFESIDYQMKMNAKIGDDSKLDLYKRLEQNYKLGYLTEGNAAQFLEMKVEYEKYSAFIPHELVYNTFISFYNIRNTIPYDRMIQYGDIIDYGSVIGKVLTPVEVTGITRLDSQFIQSRIKYEK